MRVLSCILVPQKALPVAIDANVCRLRHMPNSCLAAPVESVEGYAEGVVDLGRLRIMEMIRAGVTDPQANNFISAALLLDVERSCTL